MDDKGKRPEIRCRQIRNKIKALETFDQDVRQRILGRFSKVMQEEIRNSKDDQWLPIEYNIELTNCVAAEADEEGVFSWSEKAVSHSVKSSVVGPFFISALNMFKFKPSIVLKMAPQQWKSIYHNCGELSYVDRGPGKVELRLKNLPLAMVKSRPYLVGITAFIQALGGFGNAENIRAVLVDLSEEERTALIEFTWDDIG